MVKLDYETFWDNKESHHLHPSVRLRNRFIISSLKKLKFNSLIDIGCGDGYLINYIGIKYPGKVLSGTDISSKIIDLDSKRYKNINFFRSDISAKNYFHTEKYDVLSCSEVIEHINDWKQTLLNIYGLLMDGGYLILTTQSGKRYKSDINLGHLQHFKLGSLEEELINTGFKIVISYNKGYPFYNMQKWLFEKMEVTAKNMQMGEGSIPLLRRMIFSFTYYLFLITPRSKILGPQIYIVAKKESVS